MERGGTLKVLGLATRSAVDWSIDSLHSYDRHQLKRVLKKLRPEISPESP